eukprot:Sdes_comp19479_c0_seq1m10958
MMATLHACQPVTNSSLPHSPHPYLPKANPFPYCNNVNKYEKLDKIGQGTFGEVFKAKHRDTGEIVALKKVLMDNEKEGFPITAMREIKILKQLNHKNVVRLIEICHTKASEFNRGKGSIYMVFEYMDHDLTGLLDRPGVKLTQPQIKCYGKQMIEGLHYMHLQKIVHRDIKGSNMLINNKGELKIADFGLARAFNINPDREYTNRVVTLWYRPPELLLGTNRYGSAIDMWGVGCILAELFTGKPLFPGADELDQVKLICKLCGSPSEETWPDVTKLKHYDFLKPFNLKRRLREYFKNLPNAEAIDLIDKLLTMNPAKRPTASEALDHDFFWTDPLPAPMHTLPTYPSSHEYDARNRNRELKAKQQAQLIHQQVPDNIRGPSSNPPPPSQGRSYAHSNQPHHHHHQQPQPQPHHHPYHHQNHSHQRNSHEYDRHTGNSSRDNGHSYSRDTGRNHGGRNSLNGNHQYRHHPYYSSQSHHNNSNTNNNNNNHHHHSRTGGGFSPNHGKTHHSYSPTGHH